VPLHSHKRQSARRSGCPKTPEWVSGFNRNGCPETLGIRMLLSPPYIRYPLIATVKATVAGSYDSYRPLLRSYSGLMV
jgi:hypothetical protein